MNRLLIIIGFLLAGWSGIVAQTTIEGKVTDGKTGEPILFGTIALYMGGVLITGTETDLDGNFFLSDIQPGTYDMEASYVGYASQRQTGIVINAGKTNRVNFKLSDDAVLLDLGVEIKAYKVPLIEIDNTCQEFTYLPKVLVVLAVLGLVAAIWGRRILLVAGLVTLSLFGAWALWRMWDWGYKYGHELDPRAAIKVEGMAYQPPLIGHKQLLNFDAWSTPDVGGWILFGVMALLFRVYFMEVRDLRKKLAARKAAKA